MKRMTREAFDAMVQGARTLVADEHGPKVFQTPDGRIVKLFRRKRLVSSALMKPYAKCFERASQRLNQVGVPAPMVRGVFRVPSMRRDLVVYQKLAGMPLRDAIVQGPPRARRALLKHLAVWLARLHDHGVLFRAIHFGNVLADDDCITGLIDVSETRFRRRLGPACRARNFKHLMRYPVDAAEIERFGAVRFLDLYFEASALEPEAQSLLRFRLARQHHAFRGAAPDLSAALVSAVT